MNINEFLAQADRIFNNEGDPCDFGCSVSTIPEMIKYVEEELASYPYCVVSNWVWIDINASSKAQESLEKRGLKPCALYAHKVVDDERMRPFKSVRTTFLQGFHKNCIFLTQNTAYILNGPGTRVSVDTSVFASIFLA